VGDPSLPRRLIRAVVAGDEEQPTTGGGSAVAAGGRNASAEAPLNVASLRAWGPTRRFV
jgi:hypothetical protein